MDLGIEGKVALVTASSKGLGRGVAAALASEGCRVTICAREPERLARTAAELPGDVLPIRADVTDPASPARLVDATVERFGGLDILVANAGGPPAARALDITDDGMLAAVNANMLTSIRLVQAALPHLRSAGWGRIVLLTSKYVKQPSPDLAYSNVPRTGLWAWAKTASQDLIDDGITLNLLCPGSHATDRVKELGGHEGRMGDPDDFGRIAAFLCSTHTSYLSGTAIQIDGAGTLGLL
jgi:3-oxoacyl-[acyl-carrier protein] reductase